MNLIQEKDVAEQVLPGRMMRKCVGKDSHAASEKMTMGIATYCEAAGMMQPHRHAEEIVYVVEAKDAWVRFGPDEHALDGKKTLEAGMIMHFPEMEWHVFEYNKGGFLKALFFYGQTENIRPEEILAQKA